VTAVAAPATIRFGPIEVAFDETVLRPRPWTVAQSEWAAERNAGGRILELGCGAGHIGLAAAELSGAPVVQVDRDAGACRWAARNASANGLNHLAAQRCGSADHVLRPGERFDVVIADPPYVPSDEVSLYPDDPVGAIDGGPDGLALIRIFVNATVGHVDPGGSVIVQVRGLRQVADLEGWLAHPSAPDFVVVEARSFGETRALARLEVTALAM
jgi:release factor glutamine methyltransferase